MNCNIIKDLMVLYASGECSDDSKAAILEHVQQCPGCREIWETMETDALEDAYEVEKETEFQQVTKEIRKRNAWHTTKTALIVGACILAFCLVGTIYVIRNDPATKASNVTTGKVVYWDDVQDGQRIVYTYEGNDYTNLDADDLGSKLFDGKGLRYFTFSCNWDIVNDRSKAEFNVQDAKQGPLDNLLLNNNRATMYETENPVEENVYISSYEYDFFMPVTSKERVKDYYADVNNYNWNLYERIYIKEDNSIQEVKGVPLTLTEKDIKAISEMVAEPIKANTIDWEQVNAGDYVELEMMSKDESLYGRMWLNRYKGEWYTCVNRDAEGPQPHQIIAKLPKSIGDKIDALLEQEGDGSYHPSDAEEKLRTW